MSLYLSESATDTPLSVCVTGSPSGHSMGAAGVYYTLVTSILAIMTTKKKFGIKKSSNKDWWVRQINILLIHVCVVNHFIPPWAYHCGHTICPQLWLIIDSWEPWLESGDYMWVVLTSRQLKFSWPARKHWVNFYIALKDWLAVKGQGKAVLDLNCWFKQKWNVFFTGIRRLFCGHCFGECRCVSVSQGSSSLPTSHTRS